MLTPSPAAHAIGARACCLDRDPTRIDNGRLMDAARRVRAGA